MPSLSPQAIAQRVFDWKNVRRGPISLEIYPTLKCNLNCHFCDTTDRHRPAVHEMSSHKWIKIIQEAKRLGVQQIFVLGGGEPFIHIGIMEILQGIKSCGLYGIITTNGTLINKERSSQLLDMQWDEIHFSIDGSTNTTHDQLRGKRGSFRKTVSTMCRLHQKSTYNLKLAIHTVVNNQNFMELPEIIDLAYATGAQRVDFDDIIAYTQEQKKLVLSKQQRLQLQHVAQKAFQKAQQYGIETTLDQYLTPQNHIRGENIPTSSSGEGLDGAPCLKPFYHLTLAADGKSSPCCVLASQGGSLQEIESDSPVEELWFQDAYLQKLRQAMINHSPIDRCRECSYNILSHEAHIRSLFPTNKSK